MLTLTHGSSAGQFSARPGASGNGLYWCTHVTKV